MLRFKRSFMTSCVLYCTLLFVSIFFVACRTASITDYIHPSTDKFYVNPDILSQKVQEYRINDIVCVPKIRHRGSGTSSILLLFYFIKSGDEIIVKKVQVIGPKDKVIWSSMEDIKFVSKSQKTGTSVYVEKFLFGKPGGLFKDVDLQNAFASGRLRVLLQVSSDGVVKEMIYDFEPYVRTYLVAR